MNCHTSFSRSLMVTIIGLQIAICGIMVAQTDDANESTREISRLIEQLGSPSFATRQKASSELVDLGSVAEHQLNLSLESQDPEVRCRSELILDGIHAAQLIEQRNAFVAGDVAQLQRNLVSWQRFEELVGNSKASRKLFVEMQLSENEILDMSENDPSLCNSHVKTRCNIESRKVHYQKAGIERAFVAAIAFVGSDVEYSQPVVSRCNGMLLLYGTIHDHDDPQLRLLLEAFVRNRSTKQLRQSHLGLAQAYQLDQAAEIAGEIIREAESVSEASRAMFVLGQFGSKEDIELLEPWALDEGIHRKGEDIKSAEHSKASDSVSFTREPLDLPLAMCVKLSGQDLADYGFISKKGLPATEQDAVLGFGGEEQRRSALEAWKQWRKLQSVEANK